MRRTLLLIIIIVTTFSTGFYLGGKRKPRTDAFHDMIVNHPRDLSSLVTPKDKRIKALAAELKTPEEAYRFVRDRIANDPALPTPPAGDILQEGRASCLGKAVLLCSLYRAMNMPAKEIRVVTGEVEFSDGIIDHAWLEMEHDGKCLQQDASNLLGLFMFEQFSGRMFTQTFVRREGYTFNDKQFAVVSRLNQMQGTGHPVVQ